MDFHFRRVTDPAEHEELFRLRYQVYCTEWGFEKPEDHPGELETDCYDTSSVHIAVNCRDCIVGTARLILHSDVGFPITSHCTIDCSSFTFTEKEVGEVSRLAISKTFRRRLNDDLIYDTDGIPGESPVVRKEQRKAENAIVLGLYKYITNEALDAGVTHLYAVMAHGLYLLLRKIHINFHQVGPSVYYHGKRTPYVLSIEQMMDDLYRHNRPLHDYFIDRNYDGLMISTAVEG